MPLVYPISDIFFWILGFSATAYLTLSFKYLREIQKDAREKMEEEIQEITQNNPLTAEHVLRIIHVQKEYDRITFNIDASQYSCLSLVILSLGGLLLPELKELIGYFLIVAGAIFGSTMQMLARWRIKH